MILTKQVFNSKYIFSNFFVKTCRRMFWTQYIASKSCFIVVLPLAGEEFLSMELESEGIAVVRGGNSWCAGCVPKSVGVTLDVQAVYLKV
jgi:hypothetical protein